MSSGPEASPPLHHLALRSADLEKTAAFYRETLGLRVVRDNLPRSLWLGLGAGAVLMIEAREPGEPSIPAGSRELFAVRVENERKAQIRALAVAEGFFDGETEHTVYLRDPDGRRVGVSTADLGR